MDHSTFTKTENWHGSYYELCFELGPSGDDETLLTAIRRLWTYPNLSGPWRNRKDYDSDLAALAISGDSYHFYYGTLSVPSADRVGCLTCVVREPDGSDWLDLCIPTGMLERVYDIQYPLYSEPNPWIPPLNSLFIDIAIHFYAEIDFQLAVIGEEASGLTDAGSVTIAELERGLFLLPEPLASSLNVQDASQLCSPGLYRVGSTGG
ncbi:hypothetical protein [Neorhodopirellula lusitana]|uniref:hypothetical protein n=1 Tax=Neorhodopirellula lusitana TaxID=445327 RepID=UPI003850DB80